jgi:hypothetical protein
MGRVCVAQPQHACTDRDLDHHINDAATILAQNGSISCQVSGTVLALAALRSPTAGLEVRPSCVHLRVAGRCTEQMRVDLSLRRD